MKNYSKFYLYTILCGGLLGSRIFCLELPLKAYGQCRQANTSLWEGRVRTLVPTLGVLGVAGAILAISDRSYRTTPVYALSGASAAFSAYKFFQAASNLVTGMSNAYAMQDEQPGAGNIPSRCSIYWNALGIATRHFAGSLSLDKSYGGYIAQNSRILPLPAPVTNCIKTHCPKEHEHLNRNLDELRSRHATFVENYNGLLTTLSDKDVTIRTLQRDRDKDLKDLEALKRQVSDVGQKIQPQVSVVSSSSSTLYSSSSTSSLLSKPRAQEPSSLSASCAACDSDWMHPMNARLAGPHTYTYPCKEVSSSSRSTSTVTQGCPYAQGHGLHDMMRSKLECTCGKCWETPVTTLPLKRTAREQCPRYTCFHDMMRSGYTCTCGQC